MSPVAPPAIVAEDLWKGFRLRSVGGNVTTLKNILTAVRRRDRARPPVHQALRGVSLTVDSGEALGILGRNGSGKSTLLRLLAGIYRPDRGRVLTRGRIASLIELGAGFHLDITGRENILIEGMLLGLSRREVERQLDDIVAFAEVGEYVDQPVRTYSTGMFMRLAFAVATHTDPDILLIDEVLAVGDEAFVLKCYERLGEFRRRGKSIVIVSHDTHSIEHWCDRALWLDEGRVGAAGAPAEVVERYHASQAMPPAGAAEQA